MNIAATLKLINFYQKQIKLNSLKNDAVQVCIGISQQKSSIQILIANCQRELHLDMFHKCRITIVGVNSAVTIKEKRMEEYEFIKIIIYHKSNRLQNAAKKQAYKGQMSNSNRNQL